MILSDIDPEKLLLALLVLMVLFQQFRIHTLQQHQLHLLTMITDTMVLLKSHAEGKEILRNGKLDGQVAARVREEYWHDAKDK